MEGGAMGRRAEFTFWIVTSLGFVAGLASIVTLGSDVPLATCLVLVILVAVGESLEVELPFGASLSVGAAIMLLAVLVVPMHYATLSVALGNILALGVKPAPLYKRIYNTAQLALSTGVSGILAATLLIGQRFGAPVWVMSAVGIGVVQYLVNLLLVAVLISARDQVRLAGTIVQLVRASSPVAPFEIVLGVSLAMVFRSGGIESVSLLVGMVLLSYWGLKSMALRRLSDIWVKRYSDTQAHLRDLVAGMLNGVVAIDGDRRVTMINRAAEDLLGREAHALIDRPVSALAGDGLAAPLEQALATGCDLPAREMALRRESKTAEVLCSVSALRDAGGKVTGSVAVLQDITEQKQIERRLSHLDRLALLGEFAAGVVHEINNPLAMVTMALDNAAQGLVDGEMDLAGEDIAMARRNVGRLEKLSRQLLSFSRPVPAELGLVDVGHALNEVLNIVAPQARTTRVRVQRQVPEGLMLLAEESVLQQVFLNLASNAMQAMPEGGELSVAAGTLSTSVRELETRSLGPGGGAESGRWERSVRVLGPVISPEADAERRGYIWVSFTDTGVGMSRESLEMVGRSFFTTKEQGTGLGIAVVSKLLAQYRGVLEIRSRAGVGSNFCLWFPELTASELRDVATVTGSAAGQQAAEDGVGFRVAEGRGLFGLAETVPESGRRSMTDAAATAE